MGGKRRRMEREREEERRQVLTGSPKEQPNQGPAPRAMKGLQFN